MLCARASSELLALPPRSSLYERAPVLLVSVTLRLSLRIFLHSKPRPIWWGIGSCVLLFSWGHQACALKSHIHPWILFERIITAIISSVHESGVNLCFGIKATTLLSLYHIIWDWDLASSWFSTTSFMVKEELHLALWIQILRTTLILRNSWTLTPVLIKHDLDIALWIFNTGLLVIPIQGSNLTVGQVSSHTDLASFSFPLPLRSKDAPWPSSNSGSWVLQNTKDNDQLGGYNQRRTKTAAWCT